MLDRRIAELANGLATWGSKKEDDGRERLCVTSMMHQHSKYLESFYTLRKPVASTINTLAGALYKVFCASPDEAGKEMRQACFDYLSLGGVFSTGPISLLSGLSLGVCLPSTVTIDSSFLAAGGIP
ncbi:hypothetical protein J1N35_045357 [Gossypium stocksii]|uniref:Squalene monooxygenase n=1 Tax=Gossypium stocksii TaxID=47602 RepID=A0A9D3UB70_9ROSI|nr:hypothetical protein J1N35_045357 [Gossypium stocksii]